MDERCRECLTQKELTVLYDIASLISDSKGDIVASLERALLSLKNALNVENCVIYKLEEEELNIFASISLNKQQKIVLKYKLGEGATGVAAKEGEPIVIENVHKDIVQLAVTMFLESVQSNRFVSHIEKNILTEQIN